jgi:putative endonuclease
MFYTYILYSEKFNRFYIGQTDSLEQRLIEHNSALVISTKHYIPWILKYFEQFESRFEAIQRERFLKKQRNRTFYIRLISSQNSKKLDKILEINKRL